MTAVRALAIIGGLILLTGGCKVVPPSQTRSDPNRMAEQPSIQVVRSRPVLESRGFAVLDFRVQRDEFSRVCVIGEVQNMGTGARAVELQAALRDENGRILAVGHFYPASYTNIQPRETWPFAYSFGRQDEVATAELRIVGGFRTMETVNVAYDVD